MRCLGLLTAVLYGNLATKHGNKLVLFLSVAGTFGMLASIVTICQYQRYHFRCSYADSVKASWMLNSAQKSRGCLQFSFSQGEVIAYSIQ